MTKKKFLSRSQYWRLFFWDHWRWDGAFLTWWSAAKRGEQKKERKKWFELSHIRENHPQNGYAREYNESKAWCFEQNMQDCYIKSIDGLKLHALYLPAEDAESGSSY